VHEETEAQGRDRESDAREQPPAEYVPPIAEELDTTHSPAEVAAGGPPLS
jgi:hypothetical protein